MTTLPRVSWPQCQQSSCAAPGQGCRLALVAFLAIVLLWAGGSPDGANVMIPTAAAAAKVDYDWRAAAAWLADQQLPDGSFPGPSGASDPEATIEAVIAVYTLGSRMPASQVLEQAREYLLADGLEYAASGPGQAANLALAAILLGDDPVAFGGESLVCTGTGERGGGVNLLALMTEPKAGPDPSATPGLYGGDLRDHALVLIALVATYEEIPEPALELLLATQGEDGGWATNGSTDPGASDARTTALVLQALAQTEHWDQPVVRRGLEFLHLLQTPEGGFAVSRAEPIIPDATSTAQVVRALLASGEDPASQKWGNAMQSLARYQIASGGFRSLLSDNESNLQASLQAIPALEERPLPVAEMCAL